MIKHSIGKNIKKNTLMGILNLVGFWIFWWPFFAVLDVFLPSFSNLFISQTRHRLMSHPRNRGGVHIIMWVPHSWRLYNGKYWNSIFSFGWFGLIWRVSGIHILDHFSQIWRGFPPAMRLLWPRRFHGCHSGLPVRWVWMNGDTMGPLLNWNIKSP